MLQGTCQSPTVKWKEALFPEIKNTHKKNNPIFFSRNFCLYPCNLFVNNSSANVKKYYSRLLSEMNRHLKCISWFPFKFRSISY